MRVRPSSTTWRARSFRRVPVTSCHVSWQASSARLRDPQVQTRMMSLLKEVSPTVSEVKVREGETFESALRRFNKKIKQNGILSEVRRREHYEKPSVKRKKKIAAARKRRARTT